MQWLQSTVTVRTDRQTHKPRVIALESTTAWLVTITTVHYGCSHSVTDSRRQPTDTEDIATAAMKHLTWLHAIMLITMQLKHSVMLFTNEVLFRQSYTAEMGKPECFGSGSSIAMVALYAPPPTPTRGCKKQTQSVSGWDVVQGNHVSFSFFVVLSHVTGWKEHLWNYPFLCQITHSMLRLTSEGRSGLHVERSWACDQITSMSQSWSMTTCCSHVFRGRRFQSAASWFPFVTLTTCCKTVWAGVMMSTGK